MLKLINNETNDKKKIIYWKVSIKFPDLNPLEFKVLSINELSKIIGMKDITLRKIVYDKKYKSRKYAEMVKYLKVEPVYN